ncbi:MAG: acyltransferase [Candidatus Gastranaerophilaceae bacterium]
MNNLFYLGETYIGYKKYRILKIFGIKIKMGIKPKIIDGPNNKVCVKTEKGLKVLSEREVKNLNITIRVSGSDNEVVLDESVIKNGKNFNIDVSGIANKVKIGSIASISGNIEVSGNRHVVDLGNSNSLYNWIYIVCGCTNAGNENCTLKIGENCACGGLSIFLFQSNTSIEIGKECMFAAEIIMQSNDGHKIFDKATGELLNQKPYKIEIGDHVWVGRRATILKGAKVPSNSIVGYNAVVTGKFDEENVVLAGIPAKVIKHGIDWDIDNAF